jgi:hypothetical protein
VLTVARVALWQVARNVQGDVVCAEGNEAHAALQAVAALDRWETAVQDSGAGATAAAAKAV